MLRKWGMVVGGNGLVGSLSLRTSRRLARLLFISFQA